MKYMSFEPHVHMHTLEVFWLHYRDAYNNYCLFQNMKTSLQDCSEEKDLGKNDKEDSSSLSRTVSMPSVKINFEPPKPSHQPPQWMFVDEARKVGHSKY